MRILAALVLLGALNACRTSYGEPDDDPPFRTTTSTYDVVVAGSSLSFAVAGRFRNATSDRLFITMCASQPGYSLQRWTGVRWDHAYSPACFPDHPPQVMEPGERREFGLTVRTRAGTHPTFDPSLVPGRFRLLIDAHTNRSGPPSLLPDDQRVSNPFDLRLRP